ncbi:MAG: hypothetical protein QM784_18625 [Polyangiaceae bacterium]
MPNSESRAAPERRAIWPSGNLDRTLVILVSVLVLLASVLLLTFPFGRDQGIFAVVGGGLLHGKVPYRDLWDVKTPGIFVVFALAQALFGHTMVGPRIIEVVGLLLTCAALVDSGSALLR